MDLMCRHLGLSSTEVTYKSNTASFGSASYFHMPVLICESWLASDQREKEY